MGSVARLKVDKCHQYMCGYSPGFLRFPGSVVPVGMLPEDLTEIVLVTGRLRSTTGHEGEEQREQETLQPEHRSHCRLPGMLLLTFRVGAHEHRVT